MGGWKGFLYERTHSTTHPVAAVVSSSASHQADCSSLWVVKGLGAGGRESNSFFRFCNPDNRV